MQKRERKSAILRLSNQQNEVRFPLRPLQKQLKLALTLLPRPLPPDLQEIEVVLVSREVICSVHLQFLNDATETDVITFPYGEILVCPAVAEDQARIRGLPVEKEVLLYGIHGLLHLAGFDDKKPDLAAEMERVQSGILAKCF